MAEIFYNTVTGLYIGIAVHITYVELSTRLCHLIPSDTGVLDNNSVPIEVSKRPRGQIYLL